MWNLKKYKFKIDEDKIITSININFKTVDKEVLKSLATTFGNNSDYFTINENYILCQVPVQFGGLDIIKVRLGEIIKNNNGETIEKYCAEFFYKMNETWKRIDDVPTPTMDTINPKIAKEFIGQVIGELENKIDSTKYFWILENESSHPRGIYKSVQCDFLTNHTNPFWSDFNSDKRDYCKVTERFKDDVIAWIPLKENSYLKTEDNIEFKMTKQFIEAKLLEHLKTLDKVCNIAIQHNLKLSKDNDG